MLRGLRSTAFVVGCGCLIALITYGLRTSFGLFAAPIGEGRGWSPEVFALAITIQNLVWRIGQPFAGAVADLARRPRYGADRLLHACAAGRYRPRCGCCGLALAYRETSRAELRGLRKGGGLRGRRE